MRSTCSLIYVDENIPQTPRRKRGGKQPFSSFAEDLNFPAGFSDRVAGENDPKLGEAKDWLVNGRSQQQNFWPALSLALLSQAEETLSIAGEDSVDDVFDTFEIERTGRTGRAVNTLNFIVNGTKITLRPRFNPAADAIRIEMRRDHPSAAPHATQAWPDYRPLIEMIYAMSPAARARFAEYVWDTGVNAAEERTWAKQAERIVRPFEYVLANFDTHNARPGGALFQGLVFGYFRADSPNLTLESHAVNTGSSRADMPGDVAGFRGGEVELAVEVKDYGIPIEDVENILVDFLEDLTDAPNATAVVVADSVDQESRDRLSESNIIALGRDDLRARVITWDLPKQQEALRGALYYLGRIQKSTALVKRLTEFLETEGISTGVIDQPTVRDDDASIPS